MNERERGGCSGCYKATTLDVVVADHRRRPRVVVRHLHGDGLPRQGGGGGASSWNSFLTHGLERRLVSNS